MESHATPTDPERLARSLSVHGQQRRAPTRRLHEFLTRVQDGDLDTYGRGGAVARLEGRVAELLGKEAAVFMPTGAMASQVALRLHADARTCRTIGFHPRAHIEVHEHKGYEIVHQLHGMLLGDHDRLVTVEDLDAVREPLAAVLLELPQRDLGGRLPTGRTDRADVLAARPRHRSPSRRGAAVGGSAVLLASARRDRCPLRHGLRVLVQGS